ncbi:HAD-IB family phosphatase [Methanomassiliicoccus luminyensis]|jgi:phosphoserine phosphatase|uniref:HAD-IB family phosphatase n=1 Tax=Methanomassiliicoccus luminyensis TaxID=1080712 RepID=UPI0003683B2B|nr:HAD-IB family phosphatase [Methanomassiliicoccus luminyensis]
MERAFDLVAFDMDGVLVDFASSWTWVHEHFKVSNEVSLDDYIEGRIDDLEFMRRDIALWMRKKDGLCMMDIDEILRPVPIVAGIAETVSTLRRQGTKCVIISGGLDMAARRIAEEFGFDDFMANSLECDPQGRLTGNGVLRVELSNKRRALQRFQALYGAPEERTAAIGNSFVDVSMFAGSGLSIAFNPIDDLVEKRANVVLRSRDLRDVLPPLLNHGSRASR